MCSVKCWDQTARSLEYLILCRNIAWSARSNAIFFPTEDTKVSSSWDCVMGPLEKPHPMLHDAQRDSSFSLRISLIWQMTSLPDPASADRR